MSAKCHRICEIACMAHDVNILQNEFPRNYHAAQTIMNPGKVFPNARYACVPKWNLFYLRKFKCNSMWNDSNLVPSSSFTKWNFIGSTLHSIRQRTPVCQGKYHRFPREWYFEQNISWLLTIFVRNSENSKLSIWTKGEEFGWKEWFPDRRSTESEKGLLRLPSTHVWYEESSINLLSTLTCQLNLHPTPCSCVIPPLSSILC